MVSTNEVKTPKYVSRSPIWLQFCVVLMLQFLAVGGVPGVNESHYLPKAKHVWDPGFIGGADIFVDGNDSHMLATAAAGILAWVLPLSGVAWLGRLVSWSLISLAWLHLAKTFRLPPVVSVFAFVSWYLLIRYLHWSGEWVIGGYEAKSIAYPFVLWSVSFACRGQWLQTWILLGIAVAWHPVAGCWAGLGLFVCSLFEWPVPLLQRRVWLGALIGAAIGAVGIWPALQGLSGPDRDGQLVASQVHVYSRLSHHMSPRSFDAWRHIWALVQLCVLLAVTIVFWLRQLQATVKLSAICDDRRRSPSGFVLQLAWLAVIVSLIGLCIDLYLSRSNPILASELLRFYWFRWSDVAVPLATSLVVWKGLSWDVSDADNLPPSLDVSPARRHQVELSKLKRLGIVMLGLMISGCFLSHWYVTNLQEIPPADAIIARVVGPHNKSTDRYVDWLAVCDWISKNTPTDAIFMTPPYQQTFKWHAGRAEAWSWKDIPQDNASVIEWYRRKKSLALRRDSAGKPVDWSTEELIDRARHYGFRWVLLDRSYQVQPPALEMMYPIGLDNRSFAVMRVPESLFQDPERSTIPP